MIRIFIGYDPRQKVTYNVLQQSIIQTSESPVSITPLVIETLPVSRQGLTPFTYTRFLVPHLCGYQGWAIFLDADMLLREDITRLWDLRDERYAVMVSKNKLHFEWASVMLFNCAHPANKKLSPEYIETAQKLHLISWLNESEIGDLPGEWNHLVGYDEPRESPKLIHYTQGIPAFPETQGCEHADAWQAIAKKVMSTVPWDALMGQSVHAKPVYERMQQEEKSCKPNRKE